MVMMPYTKYKEMAERLAQFEAAVADGSQTVADPEFGAAVLELGEKVRMGAVIQQLGEQITAEADANGSWISGEEFLERAKKRSGAASVAALLEKRQAVSMSYAVCSGRL